MINQSNKDKIYNEISAAWDNSIIHELTEYIKIPNKSVAFDPDWKANGYMDQAMELIKSWCEKQDIKNMSLEVLELEGRTPLLFIDIPGQSDETVLLYGHMDKQPEMKGWDEDKGPWKPVLQDDKLYGRGGADDGYSAFSSLTAIAALQRQGIPHAQCIVLIEGCEESGSEDLPFYLERLKNRIGSPSLVICLDSGCGNYDQLWSTTSLRGLISGELRIDVLTQGIHSCLGSGVAPPAFMILRQLLDRVENAYTSEMHIPEVNVEIPEQRITQARHTTETLGDDFLTAYPFFEGTSPATKDITELLLNRTWRSQLAVTGISGLPQVKNAGNVTLPNLTAKLSIRTPPTSDAEKASCSLKNLLETLPPYNATISFTPEIAANGWHAPELSDWLAEASNHASDLFFGKPAAYFGEGGTIPFMGMLGEMFPQAQFLITGVLGPQSNAHGPNEFLHIPMAKKLTGCVASVIASHYEHTRV